MTPPGTTLERDLAEAKAYVEANLHRGTAETPADLVQRLVAHVEERMRVNVGLIAQNSAYKKQLAAQPHRYEGDS